MSSEDLLTSPPQLDDFTPLAAHETQTPGTFFGGRAVLHWQGNNAQLRVSNDETLPSAPEGSAQWWLQQSESSAREATNGESGFSARRVDVWVTSRYVSPVLSSITRSNTNPTETSVQLTSPSHRTLILFSPSAQTGIQIPYHNLTFHAQDRDAVLLGLNLSDPNAIADEDMVFLHARLVPDKTTTSVPINGDGSSSIHFETPAADNDEPIARALFDAISACQELNPDPPRPGDGEDEEEQGEGGFVGGGEGSVPGATGWITSENLHEFVDENGEFRMPSEVTVLGQGGEGEGTRANGVLEGGHEELEGLGRGAGVRRTAAEVGSADGEAGDETKWQRTG